MEHLRIATLRGLLPAFLVAFGAIFIFTAATPRAAGCSGRMDYYWPFGWAFFSCTNEGRPCANNQGTCTEVHFANGSEACRCGGADGQGDNSINCDLWYNGPNEVAQCATHNLCPKTQLENGVEVRMECTLLQNVIFHYWKCDCR